jgi:phosphoglycerol geranylgeranyltransferase
MYYQQISNCSASGKKMLAVLIDPDKCNEDCFFDIINECESSCVDFIFAGGSLLTNGNVSGAIKDIKAATKIPVILFPGSPIQLSYNADAVLFLSLISGRNPELLIGHHVTAAPFIKKSGIEVIPTGYMLVDCGKSTTASYISNTFPIPYDKPEIAVNTAIAGEMLGLKLIYLDGGSGAAKQVSSEMIKSVKENINVPLVVGGGLSTPEKAYNACVSGADLVVVGTRFENDVKIIKDYSIAVKSASAYAINSNIKL